MKRGMRMNVRTTPNNDVSTICFGLQLKSEAFCSVNVAKWLLANLFEHFIREELKVHHRSPPTSRRPVHDEKQEAKGKTTSMHKTISISVNAPMMIPAVKPPNTEALPSALETPVPSATTIAVKSRLSSEAPLSPRNINSKETDYFSHKTKRGSVASTAPDDFSGWGGPGINKDGNSSSTPLVTPSTPGGGGLMGKLRQFGKSSKRPSTGDNANSSSSTIPVTTGVQESGTKVSFPSLWSYSFLANLFLRTTRAVIT